jgi:Ca2+-binding RTX toxin-like protein
MAFFIDFDDIFNVVDDVVDFLDFGLLDIVDTFTNAFGIDLFDSLSGFLTTILDDVEDVSFNDINIFNNLDDLAKVDSLDDLINLNIFDTVGQLIDEFDADFFDDLGNLFDGLSLSFLDSFDDVFEGIDLSFLNDVSDIVSSFDLNRYAEAVLDPSSLDAIILNDLSALVQNFDELSGLSDVISDKFIEGSFWDDVLRGASDNDILVGLSGHDKLIGRSGDDLVNGGAGKDLIKGLKGGDVLFGNQGKDSVYGGGGNDAIAGGQGRDLLWGGRGSDVFLLQHKTGTDKIADFNVHKDELHLLDDVRFEDLALVQKGDRTLIRFGRGSDYRGRLAWLDNTPLDTLTSENFVTLEPLPQEAIA